MAHRHAAYASGDRCFGGPVARPLAYNPAAHGNITRTERCLCGCEREININGLHEEVGQWGPNADMLEAQRVERERRETAQALLGGEWATATRDGVTVGVQLVGSQAALVRASGRGLDVRPTRSTLRDLRRAVSEWRGDNGPCGLVYGVVGELLDVAGVAE